MVPEFVMAPWLLMLPELVMVPKLVSVTTLSPLKAEESTVSVLPELIVSVTPDCIVTGKFSAKSDEIVVSGIVIGSVITAVFVIDRRAALIVPVPTMRPLLVMLPELVMVPKLVSVTTLSPLDAERSTVSVLPELIVSVTPACIVTGKFSAKSDDIVVSGIVIGSVITAVFV